MSHTKLLLLLASQLTVLSAFAETTNTCYLLKPADYTVVDWTDDANYDTTRGGVPSQGGLVGARDPLTMAANGRKR